MNKTKAVTYRVGDYIWNDLFPPELFTHDYAYESFDVLDFDIADQGVEDHIFNIIKEDEFKLAISKDSVYYVSDLEKLT